MQIEKVNLPESSKLAEDYINGKQTIQQFFEYPINEAHCYSQRLKDLQERTYDREALVKYLLGFNRQYEPHPNVLTNIERLSSDKAVCVVGGQQAGLLTGPVYTIHKCISIIQLAKQQEEALGVPVIPVFWIAGEDHDYAEVNHVYAYDHDAVRKLSYHQEGTGLTSLSQIQIDQLRLENWIEAIFQAFGETEYTKDLLEQVKDDAKHSRTFIDFFARQIQRLFGKDGLVLLDSGDPNLRQLESPLFNEIIDHSEAIASSVVHQLDALSQQGYIVNLDQRKDSANLFILNQDERVLLYRDEEGRFINENRGFSIEQSDLKTMANQHPENLSNNVVTRPLMQEFLLPTLAFIGGAGELAYWSTLKLAFHEVGFKMPPVLLRHRLILVDRKTDRWIKSKGLKVEDALTQEFYTKKEEWLAEQHEWDVEAVSETVEKEIQSSYQALASLALKVDADLEGVAKKNLELIQKQLEYMTKTIHRKIRKGYATELRKFDRVKACLFPDGKPQERVWSAFYFINYWGTEWVNELLETPIAFDGQTMIVHL